MENIDSMGKNSLERLSRDNLSEKGKRRLTVELICGAMALVCLLVGLLFTYLYPAKTVIPALLYTVGFVIEATPIFVAAIKGVITKNMVNAMEMLVAIAVTACYFSGELILSEAGGSTIAIDSGKRLAYNKEQLNNPHFVCRSKYCRI